MTHLKSSINTIYQTFGGQEIYPSLEEKAENLIYLITKITLFLMAIKESPLHCSFIFSIKTKLYLKKIVDDYALMAITIMVDESKTSEKDTMIKLIMNFIS